MKKYTYCESIGAPITALALIKSRMTKSIASLRILFTLIIINCVFEVIAGVLVY